MLLLKYLGNKHQTGLLCEDLYKDADRCSMKLANHKQEEKSKKRRTILRGQRKQKSDKSKENEGDTIEMKITGTLPEAENLKPDDWGNHQAPHVKITRGHAKYKHAGQKLKKPELKPY